MPGRTRRTPRNDEPLVQRVFYRWGSAEILLVLTNDGELRFSEICRKLPSISEQIVSTRLADLREIGMVEREVLEDTPIAVAYSLTDSGRRLAEAAGTIKELSGIDSLPVQAA